MADDRERGGRQSRQRASERRASAAKGSNPFTTVSASKRRVERAARSGKSAQQITSARSEHVLDQEMLADILAHPTKVVTEEELRKDYSYVLADIRNMAILAASLFVLLVVLATVLPK